MRFEPLYAAVANAAGTVIDNVEITAVSAANRRMSRMLLETSISVPPALPLPGEEGTTSNASSTGGQGQNLALTVAFVPSLLASGSGGSFIWVWWICTSRADIRRPRLVEGKFLNDNLLVRIHFIDEIIWWIGLAPCEFEFPFPGSLICTFLARLVPIGGSPFVGSTAIERIRHKDSQGQGLDLGHVLAQSL